MKCEQRDCGSNVNGWCQFEAEGDKRPSSCTSQCSCSVCGKTPDTDMGGCGFCDKLICDDCGTVAHDNTFCSQACADHYAWTWLDDTPN